MRLGFFAFVLLIGIFGSLLSNRLSRPSPQRDEVLRVRDAQEQNFGEAEFRSSTSTEQDGTVELHRESDGHFYADVQVNGSTLHMLVDTGATGIALSREDARSAGLAVSIGMNEVVGRGADGVVRGEYATLDRVSLGRKTAEGLEAVILNSGEQSLLGQSFLSKFASVEIQGDKMRLR